MTVGDSDTSVAFYARDLRVQLSLGWGRIEPEAICAALGIQYIEADLGASGMEVGALIFSPSGKLAVVINKNIPYLAKRRFTAAHELGHACIPSHANIEKWCVARDIESYQCDRRVEREANEFASELLLPERVILERLKRQPSSMEMIRSLADEFGTSLTATACRVVSLAQKDPCAIALSGPDGLRWIVASPALWRCATPLTRGAGLSPYSAAFNFFSGGNVSTGFQLVTPQTWLEKWPDGVDTIREEVVPFSNLGLVLSFLELSVREDEDTDWD